MSRDSHRDENRPARHGKESIESTEDTIRLLEGVRDGALTVEEALHRLRVQPFEDLSYARVDNHREIRCGFPEVIYCQGKETDQIAGIARSILGRSGCLLATRAEPSAFEAIRAVDSRAEYHRQAKCVTVRKSELEKRPGKILVLCAGTADIPIAEEARVTAEIMGHDVDSVYDVGVAGIHRLLGEVSRIAQADALVVVAGMEGALASVVGGLVDSPVIAVPTSVGYGASFGGIAPLLTMLNSCAAGVAVVNIDNGFGAGYLAALITRRKNPS